MAEAAAQQSAKGQVLNDRTYQEVEYLKKNLGPILVAALAEICIRRPADPIEYLGHWLLRWRYNEELKRRDVQNALEVVRQKASNKDDEAANQGFTPATPNPPPGYGGPIESAPSDDRKSAAGEDAADRRASGEEKRMSQTGGSGEMRRTSGEETRRPSETAERRTSGEQGPSTTDAPAADAGGDDFSAPPPPPEEDAPAPPPPESAPYDDPVAE